MGSFRLLGVRPLYDCNEKYSKILTRGQVYQFYNDIEILPSVLENDIDKPHYVVKKERTDLYSLNLPGSRKVSVNISAIVGQNGSGKSTLLELLYGAMFNLAEENGILDEDGVEFYQKELSNAKADVKAYEKDPYQVEKQWFEDWIHNAQRIISADDSNEEKYKNIQELGGNDYLKPENYAEKEDDLDKLVKEYVSVYDGLKLDIYFENKEGIYALRINGGGETVQIIPLDDDSTKINNEEVLNHFFYSIVINYSIYGLNNRIVGNWINPLFHKNDAYQTPIVLNPMREDGNFDINKEEYLAKYRLSSNLLITTKKNDHRKITDNQEAKYFLFTLRTDKIAKPRFQRNQDGFKGEKWADTFGYKIQSLVYEVFKVDTEKLAINAIPAQEAVENYIISKIEKILWQYPQYRKRFTSNTSEKRHTIFETVLHAKLEQLVDELYLDNSHITFKLKQAINYLKYSPLKDRIESDEKDKDRILFADQEIEVEKWERINGAICFLVSLESLSNKVEENRKSENELIKEFNREREGNELGKTFELSYINLLPPSLFELEILLTTKEVNAYSSFNQLSSGEQQRIHSIQTILYHVNNINSVFLQPKSEQEKFKRIEYSSVNIVLDEIELYFHPEFQRRFISELLNDLKKLDIGRVNGVSEINILFATHSPFILSDIPESNILRLSKGAPVKVQDQTFGANIHEMLLGSFFMDSVTGEFVREQVNDLLTFYAKVRQESTEKDLERLKRKYLKLRPKFIFLQENIGEDVVREIVSNHIDFIEEKLSYEKD